MKTNFLKVSLIAAGMLLATVASAQTTDASTANTTQAEADGAIVRVVDNKGTIKYFQSNNGITTITSTAAGNKTTTTWQLGGTLTDETYIDVNGKAFALDGLELVDKTTLLPSTDATTLSSHGTGTGFTILVRDEVTGATKKLLATDLITSGREVDAATAEEETADEIAITVTGLPITRPGQIFVFRNGTKLRLTDDFTVSANTVTITGGGSSPNDFAIYAGDQFEVQWIK